MRVELLCDILGADFYTGVPDSQLQALCNYLCDEYGISDRHIIAANEGNCTALAAGRFMATGKVPVVYLQNSGIGNIINPCASLLNEKVYGIPCIFVVGWRGEPGVHDEPQHVFQGEVTLKLLEDMDITPFVLTKETTEAELQQAVADFRVRFSEGKSAAIVVKKGALEYTQKTPYTNPYTLNREEAIRHITKVTDADPVICTTGKPGRELFEIREKEGGHHEYDFLTVGSMGHCSSIALEIALSKPEQKVWCIDGDGACLMHMGAMAVIGSNRPSNLVHIVLNNGAHETVGGMPTVASHVNLPAIARACGYQKVNSVTDEKSLDDALTAARESRELVMIEVKCALGCRADLGRPTTPAKENREKFAAYLQGTQEKT